jgi:hypothetical protein
MEEVDCIAYYKKEIPDLRTKSILFRITASQHWSYTFVLKNWIKVKGLPDGEVFYL